MRVTISLILILNRLSDDRKNRNQHKIAQRVRRFLKLNILGQN